MKKNKENVLRRRKWSSEPSASERLRAIKPLGFVNWGLLLTLSRELVSVE